MARYTYIAKSEPTKTTQGYIEAESEQDAINKLTRMGYFPISVKYETPLLQRQGMRSLRRIGARDIALFTRQLSTLLDAGVNILNALNIISGQTQNKAFAVILSDIASRIKDGAALSDALGFFPRLFSGLYCSMVRTGESGGKLNVTLKDLSDFMEADEEFRSSLRGALTYPFIVMVVSLLTVVGLLVFVIPRLVVTLEDMGQMLPLPTLILIGISDFLRSWWWAVLAILMLIIFMLRRFKRSPAGALYCDRIKLRLPVLGGVVLKSEISRMMRTLSLLLSSGISITPSLDISSSVLENHLLKQEIARFKEEINNGASLSNVLKNSRLFPEFVVNIVTIGEESGSLDKTLMRIAQEYEKDVSGALKEMMRLLEPLIIVVMGLVVGFIVLAMLLPIFQINLSAR